MDPAVVGRAAEKAVATPRRRQDQLVRPSHALVVGEAPSPTAHTVAVAATPGPEGRFYAGQTPAASPGAVDLS